MGTINRLKFESQTYLNLDKSFVFDGVNDKFQMNNWSYEGLNGNHDWSISCLGYFTSGTSTMFSTQIVDGSSNPALIFLIRNTNDSGGQSQFQFQELGGAQSFFVPTGIAPNTWAQIDLTYRADISEFKVYINSVLLGMTTVFNTEFINNGNTFAIGGAAFDNTSNLWEGKIGYFRIFSKELTPQEIEYNHRYIGLLPESAASECIFEADLQEKIESEFFEFQTTWDTSVDGNFNPNLAGGSKTWVFGTDEVTTNSPNYSGSYLNGTLKTVKVFSPDFSQITDIGFGNGKISGDLDFSLFSGGVAKTFDFSLNPDLTSVKIGECTATQIIARRNASLTTLDLFDVLLDNCVLFLTDSATLSTNFKTFIQPNTVGTCVLFSNSFGYFDELDISNIILNGSVSIASATLTDLIFNPNSQTVTSLGVNSSVLANAIDYSIFTINGSVSIKTIQTDITLAGGDFSSLNLGGLNNLNTFDLGIGNIPDGSGNILIRNNNFTTTELDNAFIELDRVAQTQTLSVNLFALAGNDAPSGASTVARNSLIAKNFNIV